MLLLTENSRSIQGKINKAEERKYILRALFRSPLSSEGWNVEEKGEVSVERNITIFATVNDIRVLPISPPLADRYRNGRKIPRGVFHFRVKP